MTLPEFLYARARCACGVLSPGPMHPDVAEHWKCAACLNQSDLFQMRPAAGFGGVTFDPEKDDVRLGKQLRAVFFLMRREPHWYFTLAELSERTGFPEASISARIRDLRKPPFEYPVPRRRRSTGTWEYALIGEES